MERLWNAIAEYGLPEKTSHFLFLFLHSLKWLMAGVFIWAAVRSYMHLGLDWLICFAGYSGFFAGYLRGVFFLWNCAEPEKE